MNLQPVDATPAEVTGPGDQDISPAAVHAFLAFKPSFPEIKSDPEDEPEPEE